MSLEGMLKFKGTWRTYQARVLAHADKYALDGRVHIVAAPGSGKTTLGIELIGRFGKPTLILAPSITIREQWQARIEEAFLKDGLKGEDIISQNLKEPKLITIATYQALHSAMTRYKGKLSAESEEESEREEASKGEVSKGEASKEGAAEAQNETLSETVDFSDFDVVKIMRENGVQVLCLDECHHLRSEWWKALEDFKNQMGNPKIIALTATPPYDSTPAMWNRYMDMCGEIDEEISIPELVKEGSLCPHQDFVYFNYPTEEEEQAVLSFEANAKAMCQKLLNDEILKSAVRCHSFLTDEETVDNMLEEPEYLSALLIYLKAAGVPYPDHLRRLLGARVLPEMSEEWMEILLQKLLYDDVEPFHTSEEYRKELTDELKRGSFIEKKKVCLSHNAAMEKLLTNSKGKCKSIKAIAEEEYKTLGQELRMLVLTDYIRLEMEKELGGTEEKAPMLGVLPFFEMLRKNFLSMNEAGPRLAVLCGTIVIIPAEAKEEFLQILGDKKVEFEKVGQLSENDYIKVRAVGPSHFLTGAVTELFSKGAFQILVGTKSLLGEGWDSPCINSLILASFVGSFMLSNQMRGRAIRVMKGNPEKTSNIWHLVCVKPMNQGLGNSIEINQSEDYLLLKRRMEHFLGLHYSEDIIENGIYRMTCIDEQKPFTKEHVAEVNAAMVQEAGKRSILKERWDRALHHKENMEIVEETEVPNTMVSKAVFRQQRNRVAIAASFAVAGFLASRIADAAFFGNLGMVAACVAGIACAISLPKLMAVRSPYYRLQSLGKAILSVMKENNLLEERRAKVNAESKGDKHSVYLEGGTARDKALFAQMVKEMMKPIDNQRYLLVSKNPFRGSCGYYCIPDAFAKNKETAQQFADCVRPFIGKYELIYTRNEAGRKLLLEGRRKAFANKQEQITSNKRVKSALK